LQTTLTVVKRAVVAKVRSALVDNNQNPPTPSSLQTSLNLPVSANAHILFPPQLDKAELKKAIQAGAQVEGARLVRTQSIQIK